MISFAIALLLSIPFWIVYSLCGIGEKFFYFLPVVYQAPGFWNTVGLFMVILLIKSVLTSNGKTVYADLSNKLDEYRDKLKAKKETKNK